MSEVFTNLLSFASLVLSGASLLFTVAAYRRLDNEASETFAVIGADEGNHEARLERLETNAHLKVIPSPSALDALLEEGAVNTEGFAYAFDDEHENTELQSLEDEAQAAAATNEGMAHGN